MNEARDLQHPDISSAERTGHMWFPQNLTVEVSETDAKAYCHDAFSVLWEFLRAAYPNVVMDFIYDNQDDFLSWKGA